MTNWFIDQLINLGVTAVVGGVALAVVVLVAIWFLNR